MSKSLTKAERKWAFQHAKYHVLESINDAMTEEAHSIINECGMPRPDIQEIVLDELMKFKKLIRAIKFDD